MLVVDPTIILPMLAAKPAWTSAGSDDLVAPPLLWSECRSLLHDLARRGDPFRLTSASIVDPATRDELRRAYPEAIPVGAGA